MNFSFFHVCLPVPCTDYVLFALARFMFRLGFLNLHNVIDIGSCEAQDYSKTTVVRPNEGGHMDDHTIMSALVSTSDVVTTRSERSISSGYAILAAISTLLIYCSLQAVARRLSKCLGRRRSVSAQTQTEPWFQKQWYNEGVTTLRAHCINNGLPSHGVKADMVQRCVQHEQLCVP